MFLGHEQWYKQSSNNYARVTFADPSSDKYTTEMVGNKYPSSWPRERRHVCKRLDDQGHHASRKVDLIIDDSYRLWIQ